MKLAGRKSALKPPPTLPVVYSTDRSKAVVPVLSYFLLFSGLFYKAIVLRFAWYCIVLVCF